MNKHTLKNLIKIDEPPNNNTSVMTQEKIHKLVSVSINTQVLEEEKGYVLFKYLGVKMALLSDEIHNRMRIISPITKYSNLAPNIKDSLMHSNFHLALDARYAVSEDTLYAAFIHPLSTLNEEDLDSAIKQVCNLASSFGKTYSSGQLDFTHKR
ncbi:hypothetical protein JHD50_05545 [Sulfurimonas sp. MAG313]|nr:hypothetical protein [Sulfurimonas sp. MAG313]MDF1880772.1 hypothetical protein [Sulfurimonas sp. MAG313]